MYAAVVTIASYYLCHNPATIVPVTQLHGGYEGGGCLPEHLPRVLVLGRGGPDLVMRLEDSQQLSGTDGGIGTYLRPKTSFSPFQADQKARSENPADAEPRVKVN